MQNEKRNLDNINKLGPNTKKAALKWYKLLKDNDIDVLIYETLRTIEKQKENVASGASKTMRSYHLVGQALDWVLVNKNGSCLWDQDDYKTVKGKKAISLAKECEFASGADWGWDFPHLEYRYKGYGTDHAVKPIIPFVEVFHEGDEGKGVKAIQTELKIKADGIFGPLTTKAVKEFQKANGLKQDGIVGPNTHNKLFN